MCIEDFQISAKIEIYYIISQHFDNDLKNKAYFEDHLTPVLSKLTNYLFLKALYYIRQVFHHK